MKYIFMSEGVQQIGHYLLPCPFPKSCIFSNEAEKAINLFFPSPLSLFFKIPKLPKTYKRRLKRKLVAWRKKVALMPLYKWLENLEGSLTFNVQNMTHLQTSKNSSPKSHHHVQRSLHKNTKILQSFSSQSSNLGIIF